MPENTGVPPRNIHQLNTSGIDQERLTHLADELSKERESWAEHVDIEIITDSNNPGYRTTDGLRFPGGRWLTLWDGYGEEVDQALSNLLDRSPALHNGIHRLMLPQPQAEGVSDWLVRHHLDEENAVLQHVEAASQQEALEQASNQEFSPFVATDHDDGPLLELLGFEGPATITWDDIKDQISESIAEPAR